MSTLLDQSSVVYCNCCGWLSWCLVLLDLFRVFRTLFCFFLFFFQILVTDKKIDQVNDLLPLLEAMVQAKEPLLIVAEDVVGEALSALVVNKMRGVLDVVAVKAPSFGERRKNYLQDIAIATGSTYIAEEVGLTLDQVSQSVSPSVRESTKW